MPIMTTIAEITASWTDEKREANTPMRHRTIHAARTALGTTRLWFIIGTPLLFQLIMVATQWLQPGYNPLRDTISSMVWGPHGWLQTGNFAVIGLMLGALSGELRPWAGRGIRAKLGRLLLYLVGAGFIILAICPTQSPGGPKNIPAIIHGITVYGIVFFFPAACFLLAPVLATGGWGKYIKRYTITTGVLETVLIGLGAFLMFKDAHWFGMLERLLLLTGFTWLIVISIYFAGDKLRKSPKARKIR